MSLDRRDFLKLAAAGAAVLPSAAVVGTAIGDTIGKTLPDQIASFDRLSEEEKYKFNLIKDPNTVPEKWDDNEWKLLKYLNQYQDPVVVVTQSLTVCNSSGVIPFFNPPQLPRQPREYINPIPHSPQKDVKYSSDSEPIVDILNDLQAVVDRRHGKPISIGQLLGFMTIRCDGDIVKGIERTKLLFDIFCNNETKEGFNIFKYQDNKWNIDEVSDSEADNFSGVFAMSKLIVDGWSLVLPIEYFEHTCQNTSNMSKLSDDIYQNIQSSIDPSLSFQTDETRQIISSNSNISPKDVALGSYLLFNYLEMMCTYGPVDIQKTINDVYMSDVQTMQSEAPIYGSVRKLTMLHLANCLPDVYKVLCDNVTVPTHKL